MLTKHAKMEGRKLCLVENIRASIQEAFIDIRHGGWHIAREKMPIEPKSEILIVVTSHRRIQDIDVSRIKIVNTLLFVRSDLANRSCMCVQCMYTGARYEV